MFNREPKADLSPLQLGFLYCFQHRKIKITLLIVYFIITQKMCKIIQKEFDVRMVGIKYLINFNNDNKFIRQLAKTKLKENSKWTKPPGARKHVTDKLKMQLNTCLFHGLWTYCVAMG
jgi:hypothetical protein